MNKSYDVIIVGAGIIGAMVARYLSRYRLDILWLEKESDIGMGPSSANSAIIHSGHDPEPGSWKARMNASGNKMWESVAQELSIPFKRVGSYVVAVGEEERSALQDLYERAVENGIPNIRIISREEMLLREPLLTPEVSGGFWTPTAGVIDPFRAVVATAENAVTNGVELMLDTAFQDFIMDGRTIKGVVTNRGEFSAVCVINCAGLYSDEVMHRAGVRSEFKITPRRGEYLIFDASRLKLNNVLFPVPSKLGKGTLVTTTTHGNVMIGPNSNLVDNKTDTATSGEGIREVIRNARKLVPSIDERYVIAQFAGLRAHGNADKDFVIEIAEGVFGLINVAGIESPGFASAPAIAQEVARLVEASGFELREKPDWQPHRNAPPVFRELSHIERGELVKRDPAYGRIVCRCEEVTEGEIRDAIRSPIPARTYDAIKRRTWMGTGRCQGGFDYPRVIEILAEELGVSPTEVTKRGAGSEIVYRRTKDVEAAR